MAPKTAAQAADERSEREFAADVGQAVADTETEVFADALGDDELDNDGDTSLEEMGEGLEGDDLEQEPEPGEGEEGEEGGEAEDAEDGAEAEGDGDGTADAGHQRRDERTPVDREQHDRRGVPPGRLREEAQARRAERERADRLDRELAETRGRLDEVSRQLSARPTPRAEQAQPDPEPDMFADPDGWKNWNRRQVQREARELVTTELRGFRAEQQQEREQRLNQSLEAAAQGPRGFEFQAAYRSLTSLDPKNPTDRATVQRITNSADPAQALFDWWDENGADEYRANIARQLGYDVEGQSNGRQQRGNGQRDTQQRGGDSRLQPGPGRHVTRLPPSLNSARGAQRADQQDPEMLDDSDASSFRYATRA